ncbi:MAG: amino acid-binding protein [Rikenellaceae bacterium]
MKITQLSVFLENQVGVITEMISLLSSKGVNLRAFSVAEGVEFGIMRMIVDNLDVAIDELTKGGYKVSTTEVVCINVPNVAGGLASVLECLARENIFIQYMYAFSEGDVASTVIRPTDVDKCNEVLERSRDELTSQNSLYYF